MPPVALIQLCCREREFYYGLPTIDYASDLLSKGWLQRMIELTSTKSFEFLRAEGFALRPPDTERQRWVDAIFTIPSSAPLGSQVIMEIQPQRYRVVPKIIPEGHTLYLAHSLPIDAYLSE